MEDTPNSTISKAEQIKANFANKIIRQIALLYIVTSLLIGTISYGIAKSSIDNYLKQNEGQYSVPVRNNLGAGYVSRLDIPNGAERYPQYYPGLNNESINANTQSFLFRPFKAFYAIIYLTEEEQKNSGTLFLNLILSSFTSLFSIFLLFGFAYYVNFRSSTKANSNMAREGQPLDVTVDEEEYTLQQLATMKGVKCDLSIRGDEIEVQATIDGLIKQEDYHNCRILIKNDNVAIIDNTTGEIDTSFSVHNVGLLSIVPSNVNN